MPLRGKEFLAKAQSSQRSCDQNSKKHLQIFGQFYLRLCEKKSLSMPFIFINPSYSSQEACNQIINASGIFQRRHMPGLRNNAYL